MANDENLVSLATRPQRERSEIARKGALKTNEIRRQKRNMRELAKQLMETEVSPSQTQIRKSLELMGVEENDMTYQAALVARHVMKAMHDGDINSTRFIAELTGDLQKFGILAAEQENIIEEAEFPSLFIPENGRDDRELSWLGPQPGPQTMFMANPADVIIYGGAAGGGKTYALLLEALRHKDVKGFTAAIFRRQSKQITSPGGLWDTSVSIFSQVPSAHARQTPAPRWVFDSGATLNFYHIDKDNELENWQGSQIAYIGFDELTHFTKRQFLYMLTRNRSITGVKPYFRATCNPDSDSWVAKFIEWWIDQDTGYPIPNRSGAIRYMCTLNNEIYFADTREELAEMYEVDPELCKSVTFIASSLEDNKILMKNDPSYKANLLAQTEVDKERLLYGNWKVKAAAGSFFKRSQIKNVLEKAPDNIIAYCRAWDLAATEKDENEDAAYTAGVLMGVYDNGRFVVLDVINQQLNAGDVRTLVKTTAAVDAAKYGDVRVRLPQDPGQAGKEQASSYMKMLAGFNVVTMQESGDKATRAEPMAAQWQHGNFDVVQGEWNEMYFNQLESFPDSKFKDMVDAGSSAFNELVKYAENKVYQGYTEKMEELMLISDDVERMPIHEVNIGISMLGSNSMCMVATVITGNYKKAIAVMAERHVGEIDGASIGEAFVDFCKKAIQKYGKVDFAYTDKKDSFLYRCIKDAVQKNNFIVTVRHAADDAVSNRIRLVNSMLAQNRLFTTEEASPLMDAMSVASYGGNRTDPRSEQTDICMLNAFDYTVERRTNKFISDS